MNNLLSHKERYVTPPFVAVCIFALVLAQGGYFALPACICGAIVCVLAGVMWLRKNQRKEPIPVVSLLFVGFMIVYVISAVASGATLTTLAEAGSWGICAGMSFVVATFDLGKYKQTLKAIAWLGVASAVMGMLTYAGWLPMTGGMVEGRLEFTFQYANAAAAWYAAVTFLCLIGPDVRLREVAFIPVVALLLTQSAGVIVVFLLVAIVVGVQWAMADKWDRLLHALAQGVVAAMLFTAFLVVAPLGVVLAVALAVVVVRYDERIEEKLAKFDAQKISLILLIVLAVAIGATAALLPNRVDMAVMSLVERGYHMHDGMSLWTTSPLLGIGPNNWQYLYPWVQTAPYAVTVVHSSAVQLLLDAGLFGFVCLFAACLLGTRALVTDVRSGGKSAVEAEENAETRAQEDAESEYERNAKNSWSEAQLCAVTFLLIHSIIEFDLQFASLACLLAVLLSGPTSPRIALATPAKLSAVRAVLPGVLCIVLCLPVCGAGLLCAVGTTAFDRAVQAQKYDVCISLYEGLSLARADVAAQEAYIEANFATSQYNKVTGTYERIPAPTNKSVLYAATAYNLMGKTEQAAQTLADRLEATPYDAELVEAAKKFEEKFGIHPSQKGRLDADIQRSKQLIKASDVPAA